MGIAHVASIEPITFTAELLCVPKPVWKKHHIHALSKPRATLRGHKVFRVSVGWYTNDPCGGSMDKGTRFWQGWDGVQWPTGNIFLTLFSSCTVFNFLFIFSWYWPLKDHEFLCYNDYYSSRSSNVKQDQLILAVSDTTFNRSLTSTISWPGGSFHWFYKHKERKKDTKHFHPRCLHVNEHQPPYMCALYSENKSISLKKKSPTLFQ